MASFVFLCQSFLPNCIKKSKSKLKAILVTSTPNGMILGVSKEQSRLCRSLRNEKCIDNEGMRVRNVLFHFWILGLDRSDKDTAGCQKKKGFSLKRNCASSVGK